MHDDIELRTKLWIELWNDDESGWLGLESFFILANPGLLFIFHCKAFCNNDLQTWHSVETFPPLCQVVFAFRAYLSSWEGILWLGLES